MLNTDNCLFLIIDIQEKLVNMLPDKTITENTSVISKVCNELDVPVIITEQYPKGLGSTLKEIKETVSNAVYFEKFDFSALKNNEINTYIKNLNRKQVIICGIEAHICVLQTSADLIKNGYDIYFLNDCSASRKQTDFQTAIMFLQQIGVKIINKEIALFMLLKSSKHPKFKELQALIK